MKLNPPRIDDVVCYGQPTADSPLIADATVARAGGREVRYRWFLDDEEVAAGRSFAPDAAAVGRALRVEAAVGDAVAAKALGAVAPRVERPEHEARVSALGPRGDETTRVLTYNVLADAFRHTWDAGIHTHCPPELTRAERRLPLAVDEVFDYEPSLIALQEVDARWWERLWRPRLRTAGYDGLICLKSGSSMEGVAVAWRCEDWTLLEEKRVALSAGRADAACPEAAPTPAMAAFLEARPEAARAMAKIGTRPPRGYFVSSGDAAAATCCGR